MKWLQRALFTFALLALGYCGFVSLDSWRFQQRERRNLDQLLDAPHGVTPAVEKQANRPGTGDLVGRLDVPRLGLSIMVMEGVDDATLRRAPGHIPGTALPGEAGNIGIAGHRDTFFRPLRNIRKNDAVSMTTSTGAHHYHVVSSRIVNPTDVSVLDSDGAEALTLITCFPFYFVGAAPKRFIVRAEKNQNP